VFDLDFPEVVGTCVEDIVRSVVSDDGARVVESGAGLGDEGLSSFVNKVGGWAVTETRSNATFRFFRGRRVPGTCVLGNCTVGPPGVDADAQGSAPSCG
jgi:hypothetical protein